MASREALIIALEQDSELGQFFVNFDFTGLSMERETADGTHPASNSCVRSLGVQHCPVRSLAELASFCEFKTNKPHCNEFLTTPAGRISSKSNQSTSTALGFE
jgi:hypothetical protein